MATTDGLVRGHRASRGLADLRTGGDGSARVLVLGREKWSLGPMGPVLRAVGIGFALGALLTGVVTFFAQ